ncbi:hypothetical protein GHK01_21480, partial [Sinorhizobium meliloti]|nr:hypothetical protein [Sinorhizobium meliloti]
MLTRLTVHPTKQHKSSGSIFVTAESRLYKASKRFTAFAEMLGIDRGEIDASGAERPQQQQ